MIDLVRFFINPFNDPKISLSELLSYSATHLTRMVANNPGGLLAARITATTAAINALESTSSDNLTKLGTQKAKTQSKEAFRKTLPAAVAKIYGAVVAAYGASAPDVVECFPQGRTVFGSARDEQLNNHLQQLSTGLATRAAAVGQPHLDAANALLATWNALTSAQGAAKGTKKATEAARSALRTALALELFKNLLTLALQYPGDEAKGPLYCPQELLMNRSNGGSSPTPPPVEPPPTVPDEPEPEPGAPMP